MPSSSQEAPITVAIDGPAAAGKSSVARAVAARLGLTYVDTGAMYRALSLKALESGVDPGDAPALARLAGETHIDLKPGTTPGAPSRVILDGRDVTREIRAPEVDQAVSLVSKHRPVRQWFQSLQRTMAESGGVVMEGRDIGTDILPNAELKVFLDASFDRRVERRYRELDQKGFRTRLEEVEKDMAGRDLMDRSREVSPLTVAPGAVRIDTTEKSLEEVVEEVIRLCRRREVGPS